MKKINIVTLIISIIINININSQWNLSNINNSTGDDLQAVDFANENTIFTCGYSGIVYKSSDSGLNWDKSNTGIPIIDLYTVLFWDANNGIVAGDIGKIYKTTDGGSSWSLKTSGTSESFYGSTISNGEIYIFGGSGIIKKSTDFGETWSSFNSPTSQIIKKMAFLQSNPSVIFACGDNTSATNIYKSENGGVSWSTYSLPASSDGDPTNLYGLSVIDENNLFVCGGSKRIGKSTNGGSSWTNINSNIANYYKSCLFISSTTGYVVGGNGKILKTDNASSFVNETSGVTSILYDIKMNNSGTYIIVGAGSKILRKGEIINNNPPVATDDGSTCNMNSSIVIDVLANDYDPDADVLSLSIYTNSNDGNITINADNTITFVPNNNFTGTTTFVYQICDNGTPQMCSQATVTINVIYTAVDNDGDGYNSDVDCNDNDPQINPGAVETCDGIDNNCDGQIDEGLTTSAYYIDFDNDGFGFGAAINLCYDPGTGYSTNNLDCNDNNNSINPNAIEIANNGIDEDCNGSDLTSVVDNDGDGYNNDVDCNDNDPQINPGATEICDSMDNDCNGLIDDGLSFTNYYLDNDNDSYGAGTLFSMCYNPGVGFVTNNLDCDDTEYSINPNANDIPNNGIDENCDGSDATNSNLTTNDDSATCTGEFVIINIIQNDIDNVVINTNSTHTLDLDLNTQGIQTTFTTTNPNATWSYNNMFQTLKCTPEEGVNGIAQIKYELCNLVTSICSQAFVYVTISSTSEIKDINKIEDVIISPNPFNDYFLISTKYKINDIEIFDIFGNKVNFLVEHKNESMKVSLENNSSGIYFINIKNDNNFNVYKISKY